MKLSKRTYSADEVDSWPLSRIIDACIDVSVGVENAHDVDVTVDGDTIRLEAWNDWTVEASLAHGHSGLVQELGKFFDLPFEVGDEGGDYEYGFWERYDEERHRWR